MMGRPSFRQIMKKRLRVVGAPKSLATRVRHSTL